MRWIRFCSTSPMSCSELSTTTSVFTMRGPDPSDDALPLPPPFLAHDLLAEGDDAEPFLVRTSSTHCAAYRWSLEQHSQKHIIDSW